MKTKVYVLAVFSLLSLSLFAQKSSFAPSEIGLNLGLYNSTILFEHNYGAGLSDYLLTPANTIGFYFGWKINRKSFFVLEADLSRQGQNYERTIVKNDEELYYQRSVDLRYARVPVYYKRVYKLKRTRPLFEFYYSAGIYMGFLRDANLSYTWGNKTIDFVTALTEKNEYADLIYQPESFKELFQWMDVGIVTAWGFQLPIENRLVFSMDIRSELGLVDINDPSWRYPHSIFGYNPSLNYLLGLKAGIKYQLY